MAIVSDNDIVKALECCIDYDCKNCTADDCKDPLRQALSLINRQKAEIERLTVNANAFALGMKREAEATKEIVESIKKELSLIKKECRKFLDNDGAFAIDKARKKIDNLVKERVGEDNG